MHRTQRYQFLLQLKFTASILLCLVLGKSYAFVLFDQLPVPDHTEWVNTSSKHSWATYPVVYASSLQATRTRLSTAGVLIDSTLLLGRSKLFSISTGLSYPTPRALQLLHWLYLKTHPFLEPAWARPSGLKTSFFR